MTAAEEERGSPREKGPCSVGADEALALAHITRRIAHDLNNLVTGIYGNSELALMGPALSSAQRQNLEGVVEGASRVAQLASHLLSVGRRGSAKKRQLDLVESVKVSAGCFRGQLPSKVELHLGLPPAKLPVFGDPNEIHQLILNLCENGREALSAEGGRLEISLSSAKLDQQELQEPLAEDWAPKPGRFAVLSVRDTGRGIQLDSLGSLFEPFFSGVEPPRAGLGLTIVRKIVRACGGFVTVRSLLGEGSIFVVYLPIAELGPS